MTACHSFRNAFPRQRRGSLLLEVTIAAVILIACCGLLAQLLVLVRKQERAETARQVAQRTVANRLEQMMARTWEQLPAGDPVTEALPEEVRELLPAAKIRTQVTSLEDDALRRVRVEIEWQNAAGETAPSIRLVAWKQRPAEVRP